MRFLKTVTGVVLMGALFNLLFPWLARGEMLKVGDLAPSFSTDAVQGDQTTPVKLADYHGRKVVLYFYPKDGPAGHAKEIIAALGADKPPPTPAAAPSPAPAAAPTAQPKQRKGIDSDSDSGPD